MKDIRTWVDSPDDVDIETLRVVVLDVVDRACTRKQATAVRHYLDGKGITETARLMGVTKSTVHRHLFGDDRLGHGGGAFAKIKAALGGERLKETIMYKDTTTGEKIAAWFSQMPPSRVHLFGPLSTLLVMDAVADAKRSLRMSDLALYVPRAVVAASIGPLRAAGYIATDGVTITIKKTPLDELRKETST